MAILTGDEKVGIRSDRSVAAQLEEVVAAFQPDKAILVTDGAEDESVLLEDWSGASKLESRVEGCESRSIQSMFWESASHSSDDTAIQTWQGNRLT